MDLSERAVDLARSSFHLSMQTLKSQPFPQIGPKSAASALRRLKALNLKHSLERRVPGEAMMVLRLSMASLVLGARLAQADRAPVCMVVFATYGEAILVTVLL